MAFTTSSRVLVLLILQFLLITSSNGNSTSQHCFHAPALLFVNLGCTQFQNDLAFLIGKESQSILVDSQAIRSKVQAHSPFHPWSFAPTCTEVLHGINNKLCVYTNTSFSNGRGISIFTTPQIATEFANLPPFQDPIVLNDINKPNGPWYTRKLPDKGVGMLAKKSIKPKEPITAFTPVLLVYMENALSTLERERFLRMAIEQLPPKTRDAYLTLATIYGHKETIIQDVLKANTFELQLSGERHMAIIPEPARMNHDCGPNAQYYLNPLTLIHTVHATRPIAPDEEITIAYSNPMEPHAIRQDNLLNTFHFHCSCSRCTNGVASDANLAEIIRIQTVLSDWSPESKARPRDAETLLKLYRTEGLEAFMDTAYGYVSLTYNAVGDAETAKLVLSSFSFYPS